MIPYIDFPGEQSLPPPGELQEITFYYFAVPANNETLTALCDRLLNGPSGGATAYRPMGLVLLAFTHVEQLGSTHAHRGVITYKDIALWIPVRGGQSRELCLFPPYILVDDAATMITGREVFGLPKQLGRFAMPARFGDLATAPAPQFRAEIVGTLAPRGQNDWRTLLTIERSGDVRAHDPGAILQFLAGFLPAALRGGLSLPGWLSELTAIPVVGLKQFRDATRPGAACYQAIVEAPLSVVKLHRAPTFMRDAFELTVMDLHSHPVARTLGLSPSPIRVPLAVHFEATVRMEPGTVVWSAP